MNSKKKFDVENNVIQCYIEHSRNIKQIAWTKESKQIYLWDSKEYKIYEVKFKQSAGENIKIQRVADRGVCLEYAMEDRGGGRLPQAQLLQGNQTITASHTAMQHLNKLSLLFLYSHGSTSPSLEVKL